MSIVYDGPAWHPPWWDDPIHPPDDDEPSIGCGPADEPDAWGDPRLNAAAATLPDAAMFSSAGQIQRRIYDAHRQSAHQNRPLKEIRPSDPRHRQAKWDRENMTTVGTRLTRKDDAEFTQLCAMLGETRSHVIKVAVFAWLNKYRHLLPQEEYDPETEVWHP